MSLNLSDIRLKTTTTMQQKINWMLFLIFGISIIINISACRKDYALTVEWVYINETNSMITYFPPRSEFNLLPNDLVSFNEVSESDKDVDMTKQIALLRPMIVFYGINKCDTLTGKTNTEHGPASIDNYVIEKKDDNNFKCTFRFTNEMLKQAKLCK